MSAFKTFPYGWPPPQNRGFSHFPRGEKAAFLSVRVYSSPDVVESVSLPLPPHSRCIAFLSRRTSRAFFLPLGAAWLSYKGVLIPPFFFYCNFFFFFPIGSKAKKLTPWVGPLYELTPPFSSYFPTPLFSAKKEQPFSPSTAVMDVFISPSSLHGIDTRIFFFPENWAELFYLPASK